MRLSLMLFSFKHCQLNFFYPTFLSHVVGVLTFTYFFIFIHFVTFTLFSCVCSAASHRMLVLWYLSPYISLDTTNMTQNLFSLYLSNWLCLAIPFNFPFPRTFYVLSFFFWYCCCFWHFYVPAFSTFSLSLFFVAVQHSGLCLYLFY